MPSDRLDLSCCTRDVDVALVLEPMVSSARVLLSLPMGSLLDIPVQEYAEQQMLKWKFTEVKST